MSKTGAALSTSTVLPDETPPVAAGTGRSWLGRLRGSGPGVLIAVGVVIVWYAGALYSNIPLARQLVAPHASFERVLSTALSLPRPLVPLPHQVLGDFVNALLQPLDSPLGLWVHMGTTGLEAALGLLAGTLLGVLIATVFVHSRPLEAAFLPYVVASQTVPVIALAPIVISILGITLAAKVVVSAYLAFFSVAISMVKGLRSADPVAYELLRSYAANPWQVYWTLRFPVALPYLFTGLKVGATASLVGAIIAELPFGSTTGLGSRLLAASTYDQTIAGWSTMLASSVLGLIGFSAIVVVERLVVKQRAAPAGD
ncbi:MAG TPA: ABC transporter permease subunit [Chloroflexota bacterium]|nr:ABC transporter permease subunit [Chloroflexota bacterium]